MKSKTPFFRTLVLLAGIIVTGIFSSGFFPITGFQEPVLDLDTIANITRSANFIERYYYDPHRVDPEKMLREGLNTLSTKIPEMLVELPATGLESFRVSLPGKSQEIRGGKFGELEDILPAVTQVFQFLRQNYKGDVKPADQEYAFIYGMIKVLDPHSNLMTPELFKEFKTQTEGEYGGIGIVVGMKEDELTVIAPIEGTPAFRAGAQTDDRIVEIDGIPTINMPLSEAVEKLRGKIGTRVTLKLMRKGKEPFEMALVRENIVIQSVKSKLVIRDGKRIGVVSLKGFQEDTFTDLEKSLKNLTAGGPLEGIVLDLRNNPGGLLEQSLNIADKFLSQGDILYTVGADNKDEEVSTAQRAPSDVILPRIIVLINQGSASAAEIVAGALKNNNRALVMGAQSFGKGSVQSLFNLKDGAALKLTIAQYLTPGHVSIQAVGITPDIRLVPKLAQADGFDLHDDDTYGEKNLEEHLENQRFIKPAKPAITLDYFEAQKPEKESEYIAKIDETKDYPLNLALTLITRFQSNERNAMLAEARDTIRQESLKQDSALTAALKNLDMNWTPNNTTAPSPSAPQPVAAQEKKVVKKGFGRAVFSRLLANQPDITPPKNQETIRKEPPVATAATSKTAAIDWTPAKTAPTGKVSLEFTSEFKDKKTGQVLTQQPAGTEFLWTLTVQNTGEETLHRVLGVVQSENPLLNQLEFVYGKVEAGASRQARLTVKVPEDILGMEESVHVQFYADEVAAMPQAVVATRFTEKPRPTVGYSLDVHDNGTDGSKGNGNGLPEKGETIALEVTLKNLSNLPIAQELVNLKNLEESGIFLREGRSAPVSLSPRGEAKTHVAFEIAPTFPKDEVKLELSLTDKVTHTGLIDTIHIPLGGKPGAKFDPPLKQVEVAPQIKIEQTLVNASRTQVILTGVVEDDTRVKDIIIYANGRKIFYRAEASDATQPPVKKMPFSATIELKEGANYIVVQSRDDRDLAGQKTLPLMGKTRTDWNLKPLDF